MALGKLNPSDTDFLKNVSEFAHPGLRWWTLKSRRMPKFKVGRESETGVEV